MFMQRVADDHLAQSTYIIGCQRTGEAVVIDPQRDIDRYVRAAAEQDLTITAIAETHIHADYLSGVREMAEQTGATIYVSGEGGDDWAYGWLNQKTSGGSYKHRLLHDGDVFSIGNINFTTMHTPGHTPEHICFVVTDNPRSSDMPLGVITGDFVFVGDVGRPDLLESAAGIAGAKEACAEQLFRSGHRFVELPDYLQIWPAHGSGSV